MANDITIAGNLVSIQLENHSIPVLKKKSGKEWITWGEDNDYPNFLVELYSRHAEHGAIVKGKAQMVYGKGLRIEPEETTVGERVVIEQYLQKANRFESWNDILLKTTKYFELFNGFAWQIVWGQGGFKIAEVYVIEISKLRRSVDGKKVFYCDDWLTGSPEKDHSFKEYPVYDPHLRFGTQILYFTLDHPSADKYGNLYPTPEYIQCVQDIATDVEITNWHHCNLKNGFSASSIISLFNGEPTEADKKKIAQLLKVNHTGSNNAGRFILNFATKESKGAEIVTLTASDLDKQFEQLSQRIQQKVFTGHRITSPMLFGVKTEGQLGGRSELLDAYEHFNVTYIQGRQELLMKVICEIAAVNGVYLDGVQIETNQPIGQEMPLDNSEVVRILGDDMVRKYLVKKYGLYFDKDLTEDGNEDYAPQNNIPVNENIKNLTMSQYNKIRNIVGKYKSGKISREEATYLIGGYGLGDDYVSTVLGQFTAQKPNIIQLFEKYAIDDSDDEIVSECFVDDKYSFADTPNYDNQVLDILKGAPETPIEKIAKQLGITPEQVQQIIDGLETAGLLTLAAGLLSITEKGMSKPTEPVTYETYTVYSYVTRDNVPKAHQTREFCAKLLAMSNSGKRWTRDAIDNITNEFGEDAWTYRGGFYTNPNSHETTPYCRHIWKAITKTRKKK